MGLPLLIRGISRETGRQIVQQQSELNITLVEGIQGISDLLAFGQKQNYLEKVRTLGGNLGKLQMRMARISGLEGSLTGLMISFATLSVLFVAIPLVRQGFLDGVFLALLVLAVISSFEAILPLPQAFQHLEESLESARRLFAILDAKPIVLDPASPETAPAGHEISARDLQFSYTDNARPALTGINLDLTRGRTVAVVGPSGAGKSTLVQLLVRFWDYSGGQLLLDGIELREYNQDDVRRLIAVVSQRTHLFNATVRENLRLAKPDVSEEELLAATKQAQIHETILSLPSGYETWLGEQGVRLSSGQRQRLAIARAILQNAPFLILDEPTAGLDALTSRDILEQLQRLAAGRATMIVTHRISGLETADEIIVLNKGRIVERGRHHELVQLRGLYYRMWTLQHEVINGGNA
jgi:thiol reductant ABC exporter CydC subunit